MGNTFLTIAAIVGGIALLVFLIQRPAARSFWHLLRTKVGLAGDYAAGQDPAAQMRQAALDASADLRKTDEALAKCKALKKSLQRQLDSDARQLGLAEKDAEKLVAAGTADDNPLLVATLRRIKTYRENIATNGGQIAQQDQLYKDTLDLANAASARIQDALQRAERLKIKLDLGAARRDTIALLNRYNPEALNSAMASIDRYEQIAQSQLDETDAMLEVAADRGQSLGVNGDHARPDTSDILAEMKRRTGSSGPATTGS